MCKDNLDDIKNKNNNVMIINEPVITTTTIIRGNNHIIQNHNNHNRNRDKRKVPDSLTGASSNSIKKARKNNVIKTYITTGKITTNNKYDNINDDIILRRKVFRGQLNTWSPWENLYTSSPSDDSLKNNNHKNNKHVIKTYHYPLGYNNNNILGSMPTTTTKRNKGILRIHRNIISKTQTHKINEEVLKRVIFINSFINK